MFEIGCDYGAIRILVSGNVQLISATNQWDTYSAVQTIGGLTVAPISFREVVGIFTAALVTALLINSATAKNSEDVLSIIAANLANPAYSLSPATFGASP